MKRFHVHLSVTTIADSISFYTTLFGMEPEKQRDNYAKWVLQEPALNFAISTGQDSIGLHHLGFEFDSDAALESMGDTLEAIDPGKRRRQVGTTCCYARSNKYWVTDPQDITWENFHTLADADDYLDSGASADSSGENCVANGCCSSSDQVSKSSCC